MMSNTPPGNHHADFAAALLPILADPAKHKARLEELVAQEAAARQQIAILNEMALETRRLNSTAQAMNIVSENRKAALDAREAEIEEKANSLELAEATRSEAAVRRREAAVQAREDAATRETERLAVMRSDLEGKLARIKDLSTTL